MLHSPQQRPSIPHPPPPAEAEAAALGSLQAPPRATASSCAPPTATPRRSPDTDRSVGRMPSSAQHSTSSAVQAAHGHAHRAASKSCRRRSSAAPTGPVPPPPMPRSAQALLQQALHRRPPRDLAREFVGDLARGGAVLGEHVHDQPVQLLAQVNLRGAASACARHPGAGVCAGFSEDVPVSEFKRGGRGDRDRAEVCVGVGGLDPPAPFRVRWI